MHQVKIEGTKIIQLRLPRTRQTRLTTTNTSLRTDLAML